VLRDGSGEGDMLSGLGDDLYRVYSRDKVTVEVADGGSADRVAAGGDCALGAGVHVEKQRPMASSGLATIDLTGNEFNQTIWGNYGSRRRPGAMIVADWLSLL